MFFLLRIFLGLLFVVSGGEKVIWPYQNFLYVIESYQILPGFLEIFVARVFPWLELILGIFMILGLWLSWTLRGVMVMVAIFIVIVSQAIIRGLPLSECGCFGQLISLPLHKIILLDSGIFMTVFLMIRKFKSASRFSLDNQFK